MGKHPRAPILIDSTVPSTNQFLQYHLPEILFVCPLICLKYKIEKKCSVTKVLIGKLILHTSMTANCKIIEPQGTLSLRNPRKKGFSAFHGAKKRALNAYSTQKALMYTF